jgi:hypothetical protein
MGFAASYFGLKVIHKRHDLMPSYSSGGSGGFGGFSILDSSPDATAKIAVTIPAPMQMRISNVSKRASCGVM